MAIYRLEARIIGRSTGGNAVAAAAYRSGEKLKGERCEVNPETGKLERAPETFDYTRKQAVVESFILAPNGAQEWVTDRAQLWQKVEAQEKRKDSQLSREFIVSLPRELTLKASAELVRDFVTRELVSRGMVADVSIHNPMAGDGKSNPHAHIMTTMRDLDGDGFSRLKRRDWNAAFGNTEGKGKKGGVTDTKGLVSLRERWADSVNHALEDADSSARVDHRSLKDQGLNLEPQKKIGIHGKGRGGWQRQHIEQMNESIKDRNEVRQYFQPQSYSRRRSAAAAGQSRNVTRDEFMAFYDSEENREMNDVQGRGGYER